MFVWGTRITRKDLGWVADFCPLCRGLRPFRLLRVGAASHIWYLSISRGRFLGNEIECGVCEAVHETDGARYTGTSDELLELPELVRRTLPASDARVLELVAREKRVAAGHIAPEERAKLLREVIGHGARQVERQVQERRYPPNGRLVGWATLGLCVIWMLCGPRLPRVPQAILAVLFGAGLVVCLYYMFTCVGSYVRGVVEPAVAHGLAPLKPTVEEMREAIARVRAFGSDGVKKLKPERLRDAIEASDTVARG